MPKFYLVVAAFAGAACLGFEPGAVAQQLDPAHQMTRGVVVTPSPTFPTYQPRPQYVPTTPAYPTNTPRYLPQGSGGSAGQFHPGY